MKRSLLLVGLAAGTTFIGVGVPAASGATKAKTPTCQTISTIQIKKELGGSPTKPKEATSANVLICQYATVDLIYLLDQSKSEFAAEKKSNKGTSVSGLGATAFSYGTKGSKVISLEVLDGKVAYAISGSAAGLKKIEALAKVMLPLV